jgi:hypothetical protein
MLGKPPELIDGDVFTIMIPLDDEYLLRNYQRFGRK